MEEVLFCSHRRRRSTELAMERIEFFSLFRSPRHADPWNPAPEKTKTKSRARAMESGDGRSGLGVRRTRAQGSMSERRDAYASMGLPTHI
jgi:hypothetical protein